MTRAKDDTKRFIKDALDAGVPLRNLRSFEDCDADDDTVAPGGDKALMSILIGERGALTRKAASDAARAYLRIAAKYPLAEIMISISGYDNDPRELWDIDEARRFVCRWAQFAGLDHAAAVSASPLTEVSAAVLAKCGALKDVDPNDVHVPDPPVMR